MSKLHHYELNITWTGNNGSGTSGYRDYGRSHTISAPGKITLDASSDPAFLGDATKYNPEEFLLASLSSCHMLWFLHLCADKGIIVSAYEDKPTGTLNESAGRFSEACLYPLVTISDASRLPELDEIHREAHKRCFMANSVNFPVKCEGRGKTA